MMSELLGNGACCVDCLMLLANGETSAEWTEEETAEYLARFNRNPPGSITLGMLSSEHSCQDATGQTAPERGDECECEQLGFSWSPCDVCGSNLGGDRYAVTFWADKPEDDLTEWEGAKLGAAMLRERLAGNDAEANRYQAELVRRAERGPGNPRALEEYDNGPMTGS